MSQDQFWKYFSENMNELGLLAPQELFGTSTATYATLKAIMTYLDKMGPKTMVSELAGAGTGLEKLATVGAVGASLYVGAIIGSLAVATGRSLSGGSTIADAIIAAQDADVYRSWMRPMFTRWQGLFDRQIPARSHIKYVAQI